MRKGGLGMRYLLTSQWVLPTMFAGQNMLLAIFCNFFASFWYKKGKMRQTQTQKCYSQMPVHTQMLVYWSVFRGCFGCEPVFGSSITDLVIKGHSRTQSHTFIKDAARTWDDDPQVLKECKTVFSDKKQIKIFVKTLPIWCI